MRVLGLAIPIVLRVSSAVESASDSCADDASLLQGGLREAKRIDRHQVVAEEKVSPRETGFDRGSPELVSGTSLLQGLKGAADSTVSTDHATPPLVAVASDRNCPDGFMPITDQATCEAAAGVLDSHPTWSGVRGWAGTQYGCITSGYGQVFWNSANSDPDAYNAGHPRMCQEATVAILPFPVLQNADFEDFEITDTRGYQYTASLNDWQVRGGGVVVITSGNVPWGSTHGVSGNHFLGLQSSGTSIKQIVGGHVVGQSYNLAFNVARRTNNPASGDNGLRVTFNGQVAHDSPITNTAFEHRVLTYVADNANVEIELVTTGADGGDRTVFVDALEISGGGWHPPPAPPVFVGCFMDDGERDLDAGPRQYGFTRSTCSDACSAYTFFALQHNGWCVCGNAYATAVQYRQVDDGQCGSPCNGEADGHCGGGWRNAVYRVSGAAQPGGLEQYTPDQANWITLSAHYQLPHDPDSIPWIPQSSWENARWDGTPYNPSQMSRDQLYAAICPGTADTVRGIREVFYEHNPFADNNNPTKAEVDEWHRIALTHIRALVGYTGPEYAPVKDHCLFARALWAQERQRTTKWDAKYTAGSACSGPCSNYPGNSCAGHCGTTFLPDSDDQMQYLFGREGTPETCGPSAGAEGIFSSCKTDIPWSIKWSRSFCRTLGHEGFNGGHTGPWFHRQKFGLSFWDLDPSNSRSTCEVRAKWSGDLFTNRYP